MNITWTQVAGTEVHTVRVERMYLSVWKGWHSYHWNVAMFGSVIAYGMADTEIAAKAAAVDGATLKLRAKLQYLGDTGELSRPDADVVALQAEVLRLSNRNEDLERQLTTARQIVTNAHDVLFESRLRLNFTPDAHGQPFYRDQPVAPEIDALVSQLYQLGEDLEILEHAALEVAE